MKAKAKYEKPLAISLSKAVEGQTNCSPGSGVANCSAGGLANEKCDLGSTAGGKCSTGTNPKLA